MADHKALVPAGHRGPGWTPPARLASAAHHCLTLTSGEVIYVPMRVIADGNGSEVVFTLRRPGMTDEDFKADGEAVAADLARLKRVLEE